MNKPKLYLLIGYPGAGKTTVSKIIAEQTNAKHIWADLERNKLFPNPTHSLKESNELYEKLNQATEYLLSKGRSVVFDTNFNFYTDRLKLKAIADKYKAETIIIWVKTPIDIAKQRAVKTLVSRNNYKMSMSESQFNSIVSKLQPPKNSESYITVDGTKLDKETLINKLSL
jgi:predicted kinase